MGKDDDSGERAAQEANRLSQQGIEELRRQFDVTQQNVDPFIQAGIGQLGALEEGTTAEGLGARLERIFNTGALDPLIEQRTRAAQGALSAGGLTRSGTAVEELSAIPQELGFAIESLLTGRSTNLAQAGQSAALGLGQIGGSSAANIANLFSGQGSQLFQGINADAQRSSDLFSDVLGFAGTVGGAALGGPLGASLGSSLAGSFSGGGGGGGAPGGLPSIPGIGSSLRNTQGTFFSSDRGLKENIEPIGKIGPLTLYQWDWIPETKDMIINTFPTMGFVYDEVKQLFPEFTKVLCGFGSVNYRGLLEKIEDDLILEGVG